MNRLSLSTDKGGALVIVTAQICKPSVARSHPLAAEAEAVIAGLSQAVNAHGLTSAEIWVTNRLLFEVGGLAAGLLGMERSAEADEESECARQEYERVMREVETWLQARWTEQRPAGQRAYLQEFVEQLVTVRDRAVLEWHLLSQEGEVNLPVPLADDFRRGQSLIQAGLLTDHPEKLHRMVFGRIVGGQPTEVQPVNDVPDLTGLGAMVLEDAP